MPIRLLLFVFCFGMALSSIQGLFSSSYLPKQINAQLSEVRPGKDEVRIGNVAWRGDILYKGKMHFSLGEEKDPLVASVFFPLADEQRVLDANPPVKVLASPPVPADVHVSGLEDQDFFKSYEPDLYRGCIEVFDDDEVLRQLIALGYQPQRPLLVQRSCTSTHGEQTFGWMDLIFCLIALYGTVKFARVWLKTYKVRKQETAHTFNALIPRAVSLAESMRTAKAGYGTWRLFRESFFDAIQVFYPNIIFLRLKASMPVEFAKSVFATFSAIKSACKNGELSDYLKAHFAQGKAKLVGLFSVAVSLLLLLFPVFGEGGTGLAVLFLVAALVSLARHWCDLPLRKAVYVILGGGFLDLMFFNLVNEGLVKDGFLLSLPALMSSPRLVQLSVFEYPHLAWFSAFMLFLNGFVLNKVLGYFTSGTTIDVGGRIVNVGFKEVAPAPAETPSPQNEPIRKPGLARDVVMVLAFGGVLWGYSGYLHETYARSYGAARLDCLSAGSDDRLFRLEPDEIQLQRLEKFGCERDVLLAAADAGEALAPVQTALVQLQTPAFPWAMLVFFSLLYLALGRLPRRLLSRLRRPRTD